MIHYSLNNSGIKLKNYTQMKLRTFGYHEGSSKRKVYNYKCIHLKFGISKTNRRREIIKIRAEINEIETKKPYKELMKQKVGSLKK
jgi:hypothetical protein